MIPLKARELETRLENGIIHDPLSAEIIDQIDYDFTGSRTLPKATQKGIGIRTEILD